MPINKYGHILDRVMKRPVFSVDDLVKRDVPRPYAKKRLHELSKGGRIKRVERGKYTVLDDNEVVATHLTQPCYLSMWTALNIRGLTTQIPFTVEVVTTRRRYNRRILFNGTEIIFYTVRPGMMFGYENMVWKEDYRITVAKPEKIIIDALYFKTVPMEELDEVMAGADHELLMSYARLTNNKHIMGSVEELTTC